MPQPLIINGVVVTPDDILAVLRTNEGFALRVRMTALERLLAEARNGHAVEPVASAEAEATGG